MVAGHSLGEFSALVEYSVLTFEDGLKLVSKRAIAMQKACDIQKSTMAAVLGLEDSVVEEVCKSINGIVVAANYNCPGQLVISGEVSAINKACEKLKENGARRALVLPVGGAFHSPLMNPAKEELEEIVELVFKSYMSYLSKCTASAVIDPLVIQANLLNQLTGAVLWSQSINKMIKDGVKEFIEVGPGNILQGLIKKINREALVSAPLL